MLSPQQIYAGKLSSVQALARSKFSAVGFKSTAFEDSLQSATASIQSSDVQATPEGAAPAFASPFQNSLLQPSAVSSSETASAIQQAQEVSATPIEDTDKNTRYDDIIEKAAQKYNLHPALIKGIIQTESGFNTKSVSHAGAMGLMQLMPGTAASLGVTDAHDPAQNIDGGVRYIKKMIEKYDGDLRLALCAYNTGPGRVDRLIGESTGEQAFAKLKNQSYANKVINYAQGFLAG